MNKLKMWDAHDSWEEAENAWNHGAQQAASTHPIKGLKTLPDIPGITPDAAHRLKWKSLKWMIKYDQDGELFKKFCRHPFKYAWGYLKSLLKKKSYTRDEDFFYYGVKGTDHFQTLLEDPDSLLVLGFSYCHKPLECPSKRFTSDCIHDPENPVCRQCFIGKALHALPREKTIPLIIPTIHYIGNKMLDIVHAYPTKNILFIITACEMTLEMFGDWGNMVGIQGIGVRLDGRICNTMKAFELSEKGIKPGLTVVLDKTQQRILDLIRARRNYHRDAETQRKISSSLPKV